MKCKSIRYAARESVEIIDVDVREPGAGEVLVAGLACGVCAWDLHVYRNGADASVPAGHEGVGRVVKVGAGVTKLGDGDWVTGGGLGFAQYSTVAASGLYKIPATTRSAKNWIVEPVA